MIASIALLITQTVMQVYATHYYTGTRWLSSSINVCYDSSSLKNVNIDGSTNRFSKVASELDQARNDWNALPSRFTLNRVSSCNNWITGEYHDTNWFGKVVQTTQAGYIVDSDMIINSKYKYITSSTNCLNDYVNSKYILDYVARHEFGHYVEFKDYPENTVMYPSYNCDKWNSIKSHDSSSLTSIYMGDEHEEDNNI